MKFITDDDNNKIVNNLVEYYMKSISKCDLKRYFEIFLVDKIDEDANLFNSDLLLKSDTNYAGLTILPKTNSGKIAILISQQKIIVDVVLHELAHMHDFIRFAKIFCNGKLNDVKSHKYYKTFIFWSEFHVKQKDIPYMHLYIDLLKKVSEEKYLDEFKSQINSFFYPQYTNKFLNKENIHIRDIMWYFGEVYVCDLYDKERSYTLDNLVIEKYGVEILDLYECVLKCVNFDAYVKNSEQFNSTLEEIYILHSRLNVTRKC